MRYFLSLAILLIGTSFSLTAQSINEEEGFLFVKGQYLMETERYDDAIAEFNKIINDNPQYKDVLLLRAKAKYILGAHLGVRNDVIQFIEYNGISSQATRLLGLADYELKNYEAAINSLSIASKYFTKDVDIYEALGDIYYQKGENLSACDNWEKAAGLGSSSAKRMLKSTCGIVVSESKPKKVPQKTRTTTQLPDNPPVKTEPAETETDRNSNFENDSDFPGNDGMGAGTDIENVYDEKPEEIIEEESLDIDAINEIYVDEDLTLALKDGLGAVKVLEQPNILILSDESGIVAIDVCVTQGGRVKSAKYNNGKSTLATKSIISLAVRKTKEFWFEKTKYDQICGTIEFVVSGRE